MGGEGKGNIQGKSLKGPVGRGSIESRRTETVGIAGL